jgi:hypothetical protein
VQVYGELTGLDASASGGIRIHAGTTCDNLFGTAGVHYFEGGETSIDPWLTQKWTSDSSGNAAVDLVVTSSYPNNPALGSTVGKVIVIHDKNGLKAACGKIVEIPPDGTLLTVGTMKPYFDSAGVAEGHVSISTVGGVTTIEGWASGLEDADGAVLGAHVHIGSSCAAANGGHLSVPNPQTDRGSQHTQGAGRFESCGGICANLL